MPELPEVEVVKKSLESSIYNLIIKEVRINEPNLRYKIKKREISKLIGSKITKIERRSKYLIFKLSNKMTMLTHLGMTGKFFYEDKKNNKKKTSFYYNLNNHKDIKHDHVLFIFKNNSKLIYNDVRKFGFIKIDKENTIYRNIHLKNLGPEPLKSSFNLDYFRNFIKNKKKKIKDLLMDQKFVAGLGNIYVNEVLFFSKIRPTRSIRTLNKKEMKRIIFFIKKILKKAISKGGSSIKNFENSGGKTGSFQDNFKVYGKLGQKCSNSDCKSYIKKMILAQRASFYCSNCQK